MRERERGRERKRRRETQTGGREGGREGGARIDKDEVCKRNKQVDRKTSSTKYVLSYFFIY